MTRRSRPMSNKDLQVLTECLSYIGQPSSHRSLPPGPLPSTEKVWIACKRTFYVSVHKHDWSAQIFLVLKGLDALLSYSDCTPSSEEPSSATWCTLKRSAIASPGANLMPTAGIRKANCGQ